MSCQVCHRMVCKCKNILFKKNPNLVIEYGVYREDEGLIHTAPDMTMCNDHINAALSDDDEELREDAKLWRVVAVSYIKPASLMGQAIASKGNDDEHK